MKKSMILLGAFALLLAAPSFAQEKSEKIKQTTEAKPMQYEKVEATKKESSNKQLQVKPENPSENKIERKVIEKKQIRKVEPVESRKLKSTVPTRKEEQE